MSTTDETAPAGPPRRGGLLREPLVHFFLLGVAVFAAHRLVVGDPRHIVMRPGLRLDIERQVQDQLNRAPTPDEIAQAIQAWKRDEALYTEALRLGLDRDDPLVRNFLVDRMRERLWRESPTPDPSPAELDTWLAEHRGLYEKPLLYEYEIIAFPRGDAQAEKQRQQSEKALQGGATPASLGLRTATAKLGKEGIEAALGPVIADGIRTLPVGTWRPFENETQLVLARVLAVEGGLPAKETIRERLIADFKMAAQLKAVEGAVGAIVNRYRFEERGP